MLAPGYCTASGSVYRPGRFFALEPGDHEVTGACSRCRPVVAVELVGRFDHEVNRCGRERVALGLLVPVDVEESSGVGPCSTGRPGGCPERATPKQQAHVAELIYRCVCRDHGDIERHAVIECVFESDRVTASSQRKNAEGQGS